MVLHLEELWHKWQGCYFREVCTGHQDSWGGKLTCSCEHTHLICSQGTQWEKQIKYTSSIYSWEWLVILVFKTMQFNLTHTEKKVGRSLTTQLIKWISKCLKKQKKDHGGISFTRKHNVGCCNSGRSREDVYRDQMVLTGYIYLDVVIVFWDSSLGISASFWSLESFIVSMYKKVSGLWNCFTQTPFTKTAE